MGGGLLLSTGCSITPRRSPGRTLVEAKSTILPARIISNFFVVETKWADGRTYRFLLDTGSTVTYVTPDLAKRFAVKERKGTPPRTVRVRSASGGEIELPAITLQKLTLGRATFERVSALVFDFADFSGHLGLQIDGIIGFPGSPASAARRGKPGSR